MAAWPWFMQRGHGLVGLDRPRLAAGVQFFIATRPAGAGPSVQPGLAHQRPAVNLPC